MIIGFLSLFLDLLILNIFKYLLYSSLIFPMFTLTYIISRIYFKKKETITIFFTIALMSLYGIFSYILFFYLLSFLIVYKIKKKTMKKYINTIIILLFIYDLVMCILINYNFLSFIYKTIITIPINILYSIIIYKVLNNKKYNIK